MPPWFSGDVRPLPAGRRVGFFLVTVAALVLDLLTIIPPAQGRDGSRFTLWGSWSLDIAVFGPLMAFVYAGLLLRRRAPVPALIAISLLSLSFALAATPSVPMAGMLITLFSAAALVKQRWLAVAALLLTITVQLVGLTVYEAVHDNEYWLGLVLLSGISYSVWVFGRRDRLATLAAIGLPDQLAEHGQLAAANERRRIARELHDILAHSVSAMMMQAAGAKAVTAGMRQDVDDVRLATVERALATIENTGSQSMRELHRLLSVLRGGEEPVPEQRPDAESSARPGVDDIEPLVDITRQSGLVVDVHRAGSPVRLDPSVGLAAYRVVQESLTNAMKHGGRGAIVDIFQNWQPDHLQLQVRSRSGLEGPQPGASHGGGGLVGLRERVALIGGTFESGWVGDEFVATAVLPLTPVSTRRSPQPGANGARGATSDAVPAQTPGPSLAQEPGTSSAAPPGASSAQAPSPRVEQAPAPRVEHGSRLTGPAATSPDGGRPR